jgi:hypothetical protein
MKESQRLAIQAAALQRAADNPVALARKLSRERIARELSASGNLRTCKTCGLTAHYISLGKHERRCFTTLKGFYAVIEDLNCTERSEAGCLIWGNQNGTERGLKRPNLNGRRVTHRLMEIHLGRPLAGYPTEVVCHTCDVGLCVEPTHLWVGTQRENLQDMRSKGRADLSGLALGSPARSRVLAARRF